jgi:hypothetical protein
MSTTKHREVAKLDRVPLPVEAARIGATGWQITRTGARVVTADRRGSLQHKIIKESRRRSSTWDPPTSSSARHASSPGAFGESMSRSSPACSTRSARRQGRGLKVPEKLGDEPPSCSRPSRRPRSPRRRVSALRDVAQRRGGRRQDPAAGIRRRVAADLDRKRGLGWSSWPSSADGSAQDVVADFADNLPRNWTSPRGAIDGCLSAHACPPLGRNIQGRRSTGT